jgi:hypothetical protein
MATHVLRKAGAKFLREGARYEANRNLDGRGDAPLNVVIRAVVKTAIYTFGCEVIGIRNGYDGFMDEDVVPLGIEDVRGLLTRRHNPWGGKLRESLCTQGHPGGREVTVMFP